MNTKALATTLFALGFAVALLGTNPCRAATLSGSFGPDINGHTHLWGYANWSRSDAGFWNLQFYEWEFGARWDLANGMGAGSHVGSGDAQYLAYLVTNQPSTDPYCSFRLNYDVQGTGETIYSPAVGQSITSSSDDQGDWITG